MTIYLNLDFNLDLDLNFDIDLGLDPLTLILALTL